MHRKRQHFDVSHQYLILPILRCTCWSQAVFCVRNKTDGFWHHRTRVAGMRWSNASHSMFKLHVASTRTNNASMMLVASRWRIAVGCWLCCRCISTRRCRRWHDCTEPCNLASIVNPAHGLGCVLQRPRATVSQRSGRWQRPRKCVHTMRSKPLAMITV